MLFILTITEIFCQSSAVLVWFTFLGFFVESCVIYFQRKKIQDLADEIDKLLLDDRFLSKIKHELQKKSDEQLHTD